jgi:Rod binding domain-containing protein
MADLSLSPISVAPALLQAQTNVSLAKATGATGPEAARRAAIEKASKDFETSFLSVMLGQMFEGVNQSDTPFSGGAGEKAFQSFMSDAMAKQMVARGGVGLAPTVQKEMLKLQGLS